MTYGSYNSHNNTYPSNRKKNKDLKHHYRYWLALLTILVAAGVLGGIFLPRTGAVSYSTIKPKVKISKSKSVSTNQCQNNNLAKNVIVIISKQYLWACSYSKPIYGSAVITGYSGNPSNITPVGTYHIYDKLSDITLTGSDDLGSWSDPVSYWMGFLSNQYGQYGLHDATWINANDFGHISPTSKSASHGCVELPLPTAKWLYDWTSVGTTISIKAS